MRYDVVKARSLHLLDYLAALSLELSAKPKRRLTEYDPPLIRPGDIPAHGGVLLGPAPGRTAWLQVRKVAEPVAPVLPEPLARHVLSATVTPSGPPLLRLDCDESAVEEGADPEQIRTELALWVAGSWQPWADKARPAREARRLYQRLYDMRLRLERDSATYELIWGHGVLSWSPAEEAINHPLLLTPVVIEMDPDTGVLSVVPDGSPVVETDPVQGLGLPALEELTALRERVRLSPPDPWFEDGLVELYAQAVAPLGLDARVLAGPDVPVPTAAAVLVDTWVLFARPRPALHRRFYTELRQVLAETNVLPAAFAAIVADDSHIEPAAREGDHGIADDEGWGVIGARLLMPLPTNGEQERIAAQLARSRGVTVQGPPGTGKSHTIANLISHLVAHGKRVLVTAHNEQALSVLREKIPAELRDLSIAVLGSSQAALGELHASVQTIMDAISSIEPAAEIAALEALARDLDEARIRERNLQLRLVDLLRDEAAEFPLPQGSAKAAEVSAWLARHETVWSHIPDRLTVDQRLPLTIAELTDLINLADAIDAADTVAARCQLPDPAALPPAGVLLEQHGTLDRLRDELADLEEQGIALAAIDALGGSALVVLVSDVQQAIALVADLEEPWLSTLRGQVAQFATLAELWSEQTEALAANSSTLVELRRQTFGKSIIIPDGDPRIQEGFLDELDARFAEEKGVPRFGNRDLKAFHGTVRVDGFELRTHADIGVVRAAVRERLARATAHRRYDELVRQLDAPPLSADTLAFVPALEYIVGRLRTAIGWETRGGPALVARLRMVLPDTPARPTSAELQIIALILTAAAKRRDERVLTAQFGVLRSTLETGQRQPNASPLWGVLRDIFDRRDFSAWTDACDEVIRLAGLRPILTRRDHLVGRLAIVAPVWAGRIIDSRGDSAVCGQPHDLPRLWLWRQAQTWLDALFDRGDATVLQQQIAAAAAEVRRLVLELAARGARLGVQRALREDQRRALIAWLQALARIGKGTGKFAGKWEAVARTEMPAAMGAVPVWIMPIHRVLQSFDPRRTELFDVVIVDESSQCDMLSLGVLALGRKVVVVGDDKQISPAAVGVNRDRVFQLIDSYLPDMPQRSLLDVEASLYDIASRVFPGVVLLREHFRCVPDIIGFSNRFYDGKIFPLREATDLGIGPAIRPVRVRAGARTRGQYGEVNEPEALALVQQILDCCDDPAYEGMTFGVVTLLGNGQGRLIEQTLVDKLGVEEYERRRIRVGDPHNFQGDERDVIFISVVADDNRSAATRKSDQQRINVAASRARDQLWIFHTMDHTVLHSDDVRGHLLAYAYGINTPQARSAALEERCESEFERAVLRELISRGYQVTPQYHVGQCRIDLVVEGTRDRLAIECDGDKFHGPEQWETDLRRQRVLERQGWKFWRVRGSAYYRHPVAALVSLWKRLDELDIRPDTVTSVPFQDPVNHVDDRQGDSGSHARDNRIVPLAATSTLPDAPPHPEGAASAVPGQTEEPHRIPRPSGAPIAVSQEFLTLPTPSARPAISIPDQPSAPIRTQDTAQPTAPFSQLQPSDGLSDIIQGNGSSAAVPTATLVNGFTRLPVPVPDGYRRVAWLRPSEAAAVLQALAARQDRQVPAADGNVASIVQYFAPDTAEARKYRANALVVRQRRAGNKLIAWIREHEANAVLAAARAESDVTVIDGQGHITGLVNFFPAGSVEATTYRSVTRLLRARH
ncbi:MULTISPECIES: AAA domain-containing protein [unclassified Frankia]|uniref:AAA domain-containing protein n=1 Tax=unclassified Frankia TaxID=2632575 RepID=UPI002AD393FA|nr:MULTISPECIES: AAA domain-containing protein [unclassified Frankia]